MRRAETQYFQPKRLEHFKANLPLNLEVIINQFNDTEPGNRQEENPAYLHKHEETDDISSDDKTSEVKIVSLKSVKKKSQKKFECSVCFRIFHAKDQLQDHMKQAHQVKSIKREISSNGTIRKDGPGVRHCSFCSETFRDKWKLNRHISKSHQSDMSLKNTTTDSSRPFKCDHDGCQKFFKSKQALKSHQTTHSSKWFGFKIAHL